MMQHVECLISTALPQKLFAPPASTTPQAGASTVSQSDPVPPHPDTPFATTSQQSDIHHPDTPFATTSQKSDIHHPDTPFATTSQQSDIQRAADQQADSTLTTVPPSISPVLRTHMAVMLALPGGSLQSTSTPLQGPQQQQDLGRCMNTQPLVCPSSSLKLTSAAVMEAIKSCKDAYKRVSVTLF